MRHWPVLGLLLVASPATLKAAAAGQPDEDQPVGETLSRARAADGGYISWREHLIDDLALSDGAISGSDGLVVADLDGDGRDDVVSVHESDTRYDGRPDGHVRIAFAGADADTWTNVTVVDGDEAAAPEDPAVGDVNGDGYLDVMVASELAHLIYLQNPGVAATGPGGTVSAARSARWPRLILPMTENRGSFIRVFLADFDGDGRPEAVAANKGAQNPDEADFEHATAISVFQAIGDPLDPQGWREHVLGRYRVPQNCEPVDLDGDGDLDILAGVRGEARLIFFENASWAEQAFIEHPIELAGARSGGFNLGFADFNGDGRLDVVAATSVGLAWLEQPPQIEQPWPVHVMGDFLPDSVTGLGVADIDGDGDPDVMAGSYSRGPRDQDGSVSVTDPLGRIGWFENPGRTGAWQRHDVSRRKRGMFDVFEPRDMDGDGDVDFLATRGNSATYDGVFWLEQVRSDAPQPAFQRARAEDSAEMPLP